MRGYILDPQRLQLECVIPSTRLRQSDEVQMKTLGGKGGETRTTN